MSRVLPFGCSKLPNLVPTKFRQVSILECVKANVRVFCVHQDSNSVLHSHFSNLLYIRMERSQRGEVFLRHRVMEGFLVQ
jgi:hypothetical protein